MKRYLIIADDFTGANDAGVQLTRRGITTHVVFDPSLIKNDKDSYVLDSESRGLSSISAYNKIIKLTENIKIDNFDYCIKKIDSTLRGNIPDEVKALYDNFCFELMAFAPAFPDIGRTTVNGVHLLNGTPILDTEFANDPIKPVTIDKLNVLMESCFDNPLLLDAPSAYTERLSGMICFNCSDNFQLLSIVKGIKAKKEKTLWIGSAGICDAIINDDYPVLPSCALITSVSAATNAQIKYAENKGIKLINVPIHESLNTIDYSYSDKMVDCLRSGHDCIMLSSASYNRDDLDLCLKIGGKYSLNKYDMAELTKSIMSSLMKETLNKVNVSGIVLSGGDTAIGFFNKTEALGSDIIGEVTNGIPIMRIIGGSFDGMKAITKAGGFGNEDAIYYALRKLKESV